MKENPSFSVLSAAGIPEASEGSSRPNGDTLYAAGNPAYSWSERRFWALILSPRGQRLARNPRLWEVMACEYAERPIRGRKAIWTTGSLVVKEDIGGFLRRCSVAVKLFLPGHLLTAFDQFEAMRLLEGAGVPCAPPLVATKKRLITQWIDGEKASVLLGDGRLTPYLEALGQVRRRLVGEGRWNPKWILDKEPGNYVIRDLRSRDPLRRFIAIDPVFRFEGDA